MEIFASPLIAQNKHATHLTWTHHYAKINMRFFRKVGFVFLENKRASYVCTCWPLSIKVGSRLGQMEGLHANTTQLTFGFHFCYKSFRWMRMLIVRIVWILCTSCDPIIFFAREKKTTKFPTGTTMYIMWILVTLYAWTHKKPATRVMTHDLKPKLYIFCDPNNLLLMI